MLVELGVQLITHSVVVIQYFTSTTSRRVQVLDRYRARVWIQ